MEANKDGGTTVGFSKKDAEIQENLINSANNGWEQWIQRNQQECEHEWKEIQFLTYNGHPAKNITYCKKCGEFFKLKNLSQINKQQWEDIFAEYVEAAKRLMDVAPISFTEWLRKNYNAPEKK